MYPREDEASAEILHEVRQEGLSYVALVETLRTTELAFCNLPESTAASPREAIADWRCRASSRIREGRGAKLTVASPVRGVSFLEAAIVTGDAVMVVVVTLSGGERGKKFGL